MNQLGNSQVLNALEDAAIEYRLVEYGRVKSAEEAATARGIPLEALVKTLVVRLDEDRYILVLVPGDLGLDYRKLRDLLGVRRLTMPDPEEAKAATGYERGTITPIGAGDWPVVMHASLADLDEISLGSGVHGVAIHLAPGDLEPLIRELTVADVAK